MPEFIHLIIQGSNISTEVIELDTQCDVKQSIVRDLLQSVMATNYFSFLSHRLTHFKVKKKIRPHKLPM